jgi:hypothetical protein
MLRFRIPVGLVSATVLTVLLMGRVATAQIGGGGGGAIVGGSGVRNGTPSFSGSGGSDDDCACTEGVGELPDDGSGQPVYCSMIQVDDVTGGACNKCSSATGSLPYPGNGGGSGGGKARRGGSWAPNAGGGCGVCGGGYLSSGGTGVNGPLVQVPRPERSAHPLPVVPTTGVQCA